VRNSRLAILVSLLIALGLFLPGINWGLPSRAVDPFLFGDQAPWPGENVLALAPPDSPRRGADVDANPIARGSGPVVLNATDAQRAEIILRYRLYSHQPDEMITFRSLARIRQLRGDPRLYQYGGLWIYPVGAMLQGADIVGLADVRGDQAFYLDRPEAFGRFYVVARVYTLLWGLVATWAVFWIIARLTGSTLLAAAGAVCFEAMPVVVNMAHEAKPHLPGLSLTLLGVIAAAKYVDTGRQKWAIVAGVLCGAAFGMVISGLLALAVMPVMVLLRPRPNRDRLTTLILAGLVAIATYVLFNPFVAINAVADRELLRSNFGNSTDMYRISLGGVGNALRLIIEGASPVVVIGGVIGLAVLLWARVRRSQLNCIEACPGRGDVGWLLLAPTIVVMLQFVLLASGKPPEYARFGLLPDTFLVVAAFAAVAHLHGNKPRAVLAIALAVMTLPYGLMYVRAFVRDSNPAQNSRLAAARHIKDAGASTIHVVAEPAPYSMPPVDLFKQQLILTRPDESTGADVHVAAEPGRSATPISWADVPFTLSTSRRVGATTVSSPP